ncbi:MAG: toll/interleukin-1 receptor domain-containing protein [Acetobacteraceae bacterium]
MRDIFVSYTSSDRECAHWIAAELRAQGHDLHVHEWEIDAGGNILGWMEQHHDAADHVLCVVSAGYLKAPYSTLERQAAVWRAAKERSDFVLFVVVKPCALPSLIDHFRRCELSGQPDDAARQRFRECMTPRAAPAIVAFPGELVVTT